MIKDEMNFSQEVSFRDANAIKPHS